MQLEIVQFFREFIEYTLTVKFQEFVDSNQCPSDMRHFFYHHCIFFRLLDSTSPIILQGFSRECIHKYPETPQDWNERVPNPTRNPLLTPEEDEFLYHAAKNKSTYHVPRPILFHCSNSSTYTVSTEHS